MQFSSRRFNDDPLPWVWVGNTHGLDSGRCSTTVSADAEHAYHGEFRPRPEYDRTPHNPTNPILEWQRKTTRPGWAAVAARYVLDHWDATIGALPDLGILTYTPNMEQHARRVLTRVASFGERSR